jgi:hypothetical protein
MDVQVQPYNPNYPPVSYQNVENSRMMYQMQTNPLVSCQLQRIFPTYKKANQIEHVAF